jgi:hypothetical protein
MPLPSSSPFRFAWKSPLIILPISVDPVASSPQLHVKLRGSCYKVSQILSNRFPSPNSLPQVQIKLTKYPKQLVQRYKSCVPFPPVSSLSALLSMPQLYLQPSPHLAHQPNALTSAKNVLADKCQTVAGMMG